MIKAPQTPDEKARLAALYEYDVLDTDAERVFDDLTELASEICETPIALISLIDPNRQWFKSKVGIDAEETSRDIAFCAHAIHDREIFEIEDTHLDERFHDNPLVTGQPCIRFYAGAQLVTPDGYAIGTLCAISDQPKKLNDQQRKALQTLSREVISQLELRQNIKELRKANDHKTEFLSNMSHELRTPLNAIVSFSRLMTDELSLLNHSGKTNDTSYKKFSGYVESLEYSSKRLLSVINSVLDLSKIEEGQMPINLSRVCCEIFFGQLYKMLRVKAEEKAQSLQVSINEDLPDFIVIDEDKVARILINLVTNAIKFSPAHGQINVNISTDRNYLNISVKDRGIGIGDEDQARLFGKFQQAKQGENQEGTGLGLAITKALVELLSGEIKLISKIQKGTHVAVKVPLNDAVDIPFISRDQTFAPNFARDKRILVVEDNEINQVVAKNIFNNIGVDIQIAESGERAIEFANKLPYDIVFMDIHLPGINGLDAARIIKSMSKNTAIVTMTADAFHDAEVGEFADFLDGTLIKPVEQNQLIQTLNKFIPLSID